ncbi:hypothetical protein [Okeania sp. SIO2B3]|uniref:hypothetical protein n=1 Tax=Okeania sp. SIO2B3 TaxID=2607784 RepID=UPI0013C01E20|nr:hypothetical protein [Okeania sp. SIO2B3]NET44936.1 amino acid adenylation domain-containing protein [Okeania sp. SIO2B3]
MRDIYWALLNGAALLPINLKEIALHLLDRWLQDNEITVLPLNLKEIGLYLLDRWLQDSEITVMFVVATLFSHFGSRFIGLK